MNIVKDLKCIKNFQEDAKVLCEIFKSKQGDIELKNPMNMLKNLNKNLVERLWMVINKDESCVK